MQISMLLKSPKVKRSRKSGASENFTIASKIACKTRNISLLTFIMHLNDNIYATNCSDMHWGHFSLTHISKYPLKHATTFCGLIFLLILKHRFFMSSSLARLRLKEDTQRYDKINYGK